MANFNDLINIPKIEGVEVKGDKLAEDFGLINITDMQTYVAEEVSKIHGKNASALIRPTSISQGSGYTAWTIPTDNSVVSDSFTTPISFVWSGGGAIYFWITLGGVNSIVVVPSSYQSTEMPFFARFSASSATGLTLMVRSTTMQASNLLTPVGLTNPESFTPNVIEVSGVVSVIVSANQTLKIHKLAVRFINEVT